MKTIEEEVISKCDYTSQRLRDRFIDCEFHECSFRESSLSLAEFVNCTFVNCDFSNASVGQTAFKEVEFTQCKLMGMSFSECARLLFLIHCDHCDMQFTDFSNMDISTSTFSHCDLSNAEFISTQATDCVFDTCAFNATSFTRCNFKNADFHGSTGIVLDPSQNNVADAVFDTSEAQGLLSSFGVRLS